MSTIESRLARLEREASKPCEGHHVAYRLAGDPSPAPVPVCLGCGREANVITFVSPYDGQPGGSP